MHGVILSKSWGAGLGARVLPEPGEREPPRRAVPARRVCRATRRL